MSERLELSLREEVALETARLMAESGRRDFAGAKKKAAARLGAYHAGDLPSNAEIADALADHQRTFNPAHGEQHRAMVEAALCAVDELSEFSPKVTGDVLIGTIDENSTLTVHLFAEPSERIGEWLREAGMRFRLTERQSRYGRGRVERTPCYETEFADVPVELVVFSLAGAREAPRSAVDGRPMQRLNRAGIEELRASLPEASPSELG